MRKGENAGYQHFLLFPQCFQKTSFLESLKSAVCGNEFSEKGGKTILPLHDMLVRQGATFKTLIGKVCQKRADIKHLEEREELWCHSPVTSWIKFAVVVYEFLFFFIFGLETKNFDSS